MLLGQVGSGHPWAGKDRNAESRAGKQVSALPPSFPPFVSVFPFPLFPPPHTPPGHRCPEREAVLLFSALPRGWDKLSASPSWAGPLEHQHGSLTSASSHLICWMSRPGQAPS